MASNEKAPQRGQGLLVWMDLEMTGLDPEKDTILEIATVITNSNIEVISRGPEFVIRQPPERFDAMDDWNKEHHTKSGLWAKALKSDVTLELAESETLKFIAEYMDQKVSPLCGNSVYQDRRFLIKHMPRLEAYLHYRLIDVSTVKELGSRWYGESAKFPKSKGAHRAMDDIMESIEELQNYRSRFFLKELVKN